MLQADFKLSTRGFHLHFKLRVGADIAVVFGPSGAGKSLALRAVAGLIRPDEGKIELGERILFDQSRNIFLPPQERRIGYVPQHFALFPHLTISENIAYGLNDWPRETRQARVQSLLSLMRLEPFANRQPGEVSGGQQQRTALARALARKPDLLLMDEPFTALDEELRVHLRAELRRVQEQVEIPILFITHDLVEAYSLADKLVVMTDGAVVQAGSRDEVFREPASSSVALLMGMSNIWRATVTEVGDKMLSVDWHGRSLVVSRPDSTTVERSLLLGVRPEEVVIVRRGRKLQPEMKENLFTGKIVEDRPQGFDHLLSVELETVDGEAENVYVRIPHPVFVKLELAPGQERTFAVKPGAIHILPASDDSRQRGWTDDA